MSNLFGYKAFYQDADGLYCQPDESKEKFRYEEGKVYEIEGELELCVNGLHFCKELKDIFNFYPLVQWIKVHKVEILGKVTSGYGNDRKSCTNKLKVLEEVSFEEIIELLKIFYIKKDHIYSSDYSNIINYSDGADYSKGVIESKGIDDSYGICFSNGVVGSRGIRRSDGVYESDGISSSDGVHCSKGVHGSYGVHRTKGVHDSNSVSISCGISSSNGVRCSFGIYNSDGVYGSDGIGRSNGICDSYGVNRSNGVNSSKGINNSEGVFNSRGVDSSFGVLNSFGVSNALFLANKKESYSLFGVEVSEERFNEVKIELNFYLGYWKPTYNNLKGLYLKFGEDWKFTPIQAAEEIQKEEAWKDMPVEAIRYLMGLKEFDKTIFKEITGIDVDEIDK